MDQTAPLTQSKLAAARLRSQDLVDGLHFRQTSVIERIIKVRLAKQHERAASSFCTAMPDLRDTVGTYVC